MKGKVKHLFTSLLLLFSIQQVMADAMSVANIEVNVGGEAEIVVNFQTEATNITGYQMSLYLPEGVTLQKDEDDDYLYELSSRHNMSHTFSVSSQSDGGLLLVCYSLTKKTIAPGSDELLRLPASVATNTPGTLTAYLKDIKMSDTNSNVTQLSNVTFTLTVTDHEHSSVSFIWDFTKGLSEETVANLNADTGNWVVNTQDEVTGEATSWKNTTKRSGDPFTMMANGVAVKEAEGLSFIMYEQRSNCFILYQNKLRMQRANTVITFPQLKQGQTITITGASANSTATNRGIEPVQDYLTLVEGTQTDGQCMFLGKAVEGSLGTYSFTWKVDSPNSELQDVQFNILGGGVDFFKFEIDGKNTVIPVNAAKLGLTQGNQLYLETGTEIGSNEFMKLSVATPDTYETCSPFKTGYPSITDIYFGIDGITYSKKENSYMRGITSATDENGRHPDSYLKVPVAGNAYSIEAKKDGFAYIWGIFSVAKAYTLFEDSVAVGYRLVIDTKGSELEAFEGHDRLDIMYGSYSTRFTKAIPTPWTLLTGDSIQEYYYSAGVMMFPVKAGSKYIMCGNGTNFVLAGALFSERGNSRITALIDNFGVGLLDGISQPTTYYKEENAPLSQTLALTTLPAMTYGDAAYALPATTTEGLPLTWASSNTAVATVNKGKLTVVGAGRATITATQTGNEGYLPFSRDFTLTVNKAVLTITADDKTKVAGEENPVLTASYIGFKNGDTNGVLTKQPVIATTATKDSPAGTYPITVSGATAANYTFNYVNGTLTVTEATPVPDPTGYKLYPAEFSIRKGESETMSINLENEQGIIMAEFYMQLPEGITIATDGDGYLEATLNDSRTDRTHSLEVELGSDGLYHFLAYSNKNKPFTGNEGELISVTLNCNESVEAGEYQGTLKSILLSDADKQAIQPADLTFAIEVTDYIPGDVNDDRRINGMDIVEMVELIMSQGYSKAADLYPAGQPDGKVNGMDLVEEVELVMSQPAQQAAQLRMANGFKQGLTLTPQIGGTLALGVTTGRRYLMSQCLVQLGEGMRLDDVTTDAHHTAAWRDLGNGLYVVVAYSGSNQAFADNDALLSLHCTGEGTVTVTDVLMADELRQECRFAAVSLSGTDAICNVQASTSNHQHTYDLQGRVINSQFTVNHSSLQQGVYIVNGRKVVLK